MDLGLEEFCTSEKIVAFLKPYYCSLVYSTCSALSLLT